MARNGSSFLGLPKETQSDVFRLADHGAHHPDADVAAMAWEWAIAARAPLGVGQVLGEFVSGVMLPGSSDLGLVLRRRRHARKLLELGHPGG